MVAAGSGSGPSAAGHGLSHRLMALARVMCGRHGIRWFEGDDFDRGRNRGGAEYLQAIGINLHED